MIWTLKRVNTLQETEGVAGKVRAAKSREHQLRQEGMTGTRAGKAAVAAVAAVKTKQQKKKKKSPNKCAASCCVPSCIDTRQMIMKQHFDCSKANEPLQGDVDQAGHLTIFTPK